MKSFFLSFFFLILISTIYGQSKKAALVQDLTKNVLTVKTAKNTFQQEIEKQDDYILKLTTIKTSPKGQEVKTSYEFSLSDINKNTVLEQTKGDKIIVKLSCKANNKLIKSFSGENTVKYVSNFHILAENIDNARAIKSIIKQIIPLAEAETNARFKPTTYNELLSWLETNISDADCGKIKTEQLFQKENVDVGTVTLNQKKITNSKVNEVNYAFNLGDLNAYSLAYDIKTSEMAITVETILRKPFIKASNIEKQLPYTKKISIYVNDSENAKDLKMALSRIIPLARKKMEGSLPKSSNLSNLLSLLTNNVQDVSNSSISVTQHIDPKIITNFQAVTSTPNAMIKNDYQFFIGDLNENNIQTKISGINIVTTVQIKAKKNFIKSIKDDILQNYASSIKIYSSSIENYRHLETILKQLIPVTESHYKSTVPEGSSKIKINWATKQMEALSVGLYSYDQKLEFDGKTILKYTLIKSSSKKSVETVYECNYEDLDSRAVDLIVKGKQIFVKFETKYKRKIINLYIDGVIKPYTNTFQCQFGEIEVARNFMLAMKKALDKK